MLTPDEHSELAQLVTQLSRKAVEYGITRGIQGADTEEVRQLRADTTEAEDAVMRWATEHTEWLGDRG